MEYVMRDSDVMDYKSSACPRGEASEQKLKKIMSLHASRPA